MNRSRPAEPPTPVSPVIAVINSNDDLVQLLRDELARAGFTVVTAHVREFKSGHEDFSAFLSGHKPDVVVYDISVPYEENWSFFQNVRSVPEAQDRHVVVTTVNKRVLEERVGPTGAIEIQGGRADDLD